MVSDNPSIKFPDWMVEEIDERRPSTQSRSEWVRQACMARMNAEDDDEWQTPEVKRPGSSTVI